MTRIVVPFEVTKREMTPYGDDVPGPMLARAVFYKKYTGDLDGVGIAEALMCQADPKDLSAGAGYVASERVTGSLGGRKGSFMIQHWGLSGGGAPNRTAGHVIPGSGTGELAGLTGTMEISITKETGHQLILEYELPSAPKT